jgi:cell division protein FtsA
MCKNEKIQIPEANKQIDKKDLSQVIQCRLEELLEGVVYQLQQWEYTDPESKIYFTGDGSRIADTDTLLGKLSGQQVVVPRAQNVATTNEALLEAPACLAVIGLLSCEKDEPEEEKGNFGRWLSGIFK